MFNVSANYDLQKESLGNTSFCQLNQKRYLWYVYPCDDQKTYNLWGLDALCRFRHPHLQQAYHIYLNPTSCNLLFPVYTNTVNKLLNNSTSFHDKIIFFYQLLDALAFLHRQELTHNHISLQSVFFLDEKILLCNLTKIEYLSSREKYRKDLKDLATIFWLVMVENEKFEFPSYTLEEIEEKITPQNYYQMQFIRLLWHMNNSDDPFTATEYLRFPIFEQCSILPFTDKDYLNFQGMDPKPELPYPSDCRTTLKIFVNKTFELFPELDIRYIFRAIIASLRLRGLGLPLQDILWIMLYFSHTPAKVEEYCTKVELDYSTLKRWQIKIIDYLDGHLWVDFLTPHCLNQEQYATLYFDIVLHQDSSTLLKVEVENLPAFFGSTVVKQLSCTQSDIRGTK